ncbi:DNA-binding response regulator [Mycobacterium sp. MS1601]|nr:DNA-binding response regulator [Mycobacterium sp. MS1601]
MAPTWAPAAQESAEHLSNLRTLLIDDSTLHRENLAAVLTAGGFAMPALAWDFDSMQQALREMVPEIVLVNMATRDNMTLLRSVREKCPHAKIVVVGVAVEDESVIVSCAEAGVAGYHLRTDSLDDLVSLIGAVSNGEPCCPPKVSAILLKRLSALAAQREPAAKELVLTAREVEILRMLELGLSNREIAGQLCIALHTVKNHVHSLLGKLGVSTRMEAAALSRSSRLASSEI